MHRTVSAPSTHTNLNRFNYQAAPASHLQKLIENQFTIKSLEISPHGKTGVIFVQTNSGAFVLKSNNDGPIDQFFNRMAAQMHLNVPQTMCYCPSDILFHKLIFQIQKFCQKDEILAARMKSRLDFPFYQILEYIPSISLAQTGRNRFEKHMLDQHKLLQMGMCIGYDLITNNSDRFKLVWGSDGNINNILIQVQDYEAHGLTEIKDRNNVEVQLGDYVFIDHSGYLLDLSNEMAASNFEKFMEKVCDFHNHMLKFLADEEPYPKMFQKLRQQLQLFTHYPLNGVDLKHISKGIVYSTNKFLQIFQNKSLEDLYNSLLRSQSSILNKKGKENTYWCTYWNQTLKKINLKFLQEVYTKISAIHITYPQIINDILKEVEEQITPKKYEFSDLENHPTSPPIEKGSEPPSNSQLPEEQQQQMSEPASKGSKVQQNPHENKDSKGSKSNKKSALSNHDLFKQLKVRKWRYKIAKYKEQNADIQNPKKYQ